MFKSCYVKIKNDSGEVFFPYSFKTEDVVIKEKEIANCCWLRHFLLQKTQSLLLQVLICN